MKISIGNFLIDRLISMGITRVYGVPGDYNLDFIDLIEKHPDISFIGTCNELNSAYAADGEARISGISAVLTTYGVGDLSALSGIAGAFAEHVPVIMISGIPPLKAIRNRALVHHTGADGNYDNIMNCFCGFTVVHTRITPENIVDNVDRAIRACYREKQPVYIQVPSDLFLQDIEVMESPFVHETFTSNPETLSLVTARILAMLEKAENPLILVDNAARNDNVARKLVRFIREFRIPFATTPSGKSTLSESNEYFIGMYSGRSSSDTIYNTVAKADFILGIGVRFTDATSSWFSQSSNTVMMVNAHLFDVQMENNFYPGIALEDLITCLLDSRFSSSRPVCHQYTTPSLPSETSTLYSQMVWNQDNFWDRISHFLLPEDVIVSDNGTSSIAMTRSHLPADCTFILQSTWAAIGYALPALLGTLLAAPERRQLLFIGDGSFQVTAQELSTIIRYDLKPIIFLINNKGYTIERSIVGENAPYNDIANWDYAALPALLGEDVQVQSFSINTMHDLDTTLTSLEGQREYLTFIEVHFNRTDYPQGMTAFGKLAHGYNSQTWLRYERP